MVSETNHWHPSKTFGLERWHDGEEDALMITERNTSFFEKLFFSNDGVGWISECPRKASNSVPQAQVVLEAKRIRRELQGGQKMECKTSKCKWKTICFPTGNRYFGGK